MAVEFKEAAGDWLRVETLDLGGGRRVIGYIELTSARFRPRSYELLEAEELERIAERLHSIRRKRRQALRELRETSERRAGHGG